MNPPFQGVCYVGLLTVLTIIVGCGKGAPTQCSMKSTEEPRPRVQSADTPQAAMRNMTAAGRKGDKELFASCFIDSPESTEIMQAMYSSIRADVEFRDAIVQAYGEEGWAIFRKPPAGAQVGFHMSVYDEDSLASIKRANFEISGDTAAMRDHTDESGPPTVLKKTNRGWQIDAAASLLPGTDPARFAEIMAEMTKMVVRYKGTIGKPGIRPEDINSEMGREFWAIIFGYATTQPDQSEVEQF